MNVGRITATDFNIQLQQVDDFPVCQLTERSRKFERCSQSPIHVFSSVSMLLGLTILLVLLAWMLGNTNIALALLLVHTSTCTDRSCRSTRKLLATGLQALMNVGCILSATRLLRRIELQPAVIAVRMSIALAIDSAASLQSLVASRLPEYRSGAIDWTPNRRLNQLAVRCY